MCGTLHCQGGMDTPILTSGATGLSSTNTQVQWRPDTQLCSLGANIGVKSDDVII